MSAGSIRKTGVDGVPYNAAADADIGLNPRIEKEPIPHSGGNMIKRTFVGAMAESVKLILSPAEYSVLEAQAAAIGDIPLSYTMADGSTIRTVGEVNLGPYQTAESACEVQMLTSTGIWEVFSVT